MQLKWFVFPFFTFFYFNSFSNETTKHIIFQEQRGGQRSAVTRESFSAVGESDMQQSGWTRVTLVAWPPTALRTRDLYNVLWHVYFPSNSDDLNSNPRGKLVL